MINRNPHKLSFVLVATDQSTMLVNRNDYHTYGPSIEDNTYGLGYQIFEVGGFMFHEIEMLKSILDNRREIKSDTVLMVDCGANIGVHTVNLAKHMTGWGYVLGFEPQERIYYALAGNVTINNCFNARVIQGALTNKTGTMVIPQLDHQNMCSFGSLELEHIGNPENIGQHIDRDNVVPCDGYTVDIFNLDRVDLMKVDVEGMEMKVLEGAKATIEKSKPIIFAEYIKVGAETLEDYFRSIDYVFRKDNENILGFHKDDPGFEFLSKIGENFS